MDETINEDKQLYYCSECDEEFNSTEIKSVEDECPNCHMTKIRKYNDHV